MKHVDVVASGIQFDRQYLREVYFRDAESLSSNQQLHALLDVRWKLNDEETACAVQLEVQFSEAEEPTEEQVRIRLILEARFSAVGETSVSLASFARVQAPVILMPFLREHVAAITGRTRLGQLLINPLNLARAIAQQESATGAAPKN